MPSRPTYYRGLVTPLGSFKRGPCLAILILAIYVRPIGFHGPTSIIRASTFGMLLIGNPNLDAAILEFSAICFRPER